MKLQLTGTGLIVASIFAMGIAQIATIFTTIFFYLCMAFAMSQVDVGPKVSLTALFLGALSGVVIFLASENLGLTIFVTSCTTAAYSYAFPAK